MVTRVRVSPARSNVLQRVRLGGFTLGTCKNVQRQRSRAGQLRVGIVLAGVMLWVHSPALVESLWVTVVPWSTTPGAGATTRMDPCFSWPNWYPLVFEDVDMSALTTRLPNCKLSLAPGDVGGNLLQGLGARNESVDSLRSISLPSSRSLPDNCGEESSCVVLCELQRGKQATWASTMKTDFKGQNPIPRRGSPEVSALNTKRVVHVYPRWKESRTEGYGSTDSLTEVCVRGSPSKFMSLSFHDIGTSALFLRDGAKVLCQHPRVLNCYKMQEVSDILLLEHTRSLSYRDFGARGHSEAPVTVFCEFEGVSRGATASALKALHPVVLGVGRPAGPAASARRTWVGFAQPDSDSTSDGPGSLNHAPPESLPEGYRAVAAYPVWTEWSNVGFGGGDWVPVVANHPVEFRSLNYDAIADKKVFAEGHGFKKCGKPRVPTERWPPSRAFRNARPLAPKDFDTTDPKSDAYRGGRLIVFCEVDGVSTSGAARALLPAPPIVDRQSEEKSAAKKLVFTGLVDTQRRLNATRSRVTFPYIRTVVSSLFRHLRLTGYAFVAKHKIPDARSFLVCRFAQGRMKRANLDCGIVVARLQR